MSRGLSQIASLIVSTFTPTFEYCKYIFVKVLSLKTNAPAHRASSINDSSISFSKKRRACAIRFPCNFNQEGHGTESPTGSHTLLPLPSRQHVPMISTVSQFYNRNVKVSCKSVVEQHGVYTVRASTVVPNIIVRIGAIRSVKINSTYCGRKGQGARVLLIITGLLLCKADSGEH